MLISRIPWSMAYRKNNNGRSTGPNAWLGRKQLTSNLNSIDCPWHLRFSVLLSKKEIIQSFTLSFWNVDAFKNKWSFVYMWIDLKTIPNSRNSELKKWSIFQIDNTLFYVKAFTVLPAWIALQNSSFVGKKNFAELGWNSAVKRGWWVGMGVLQGAKAKMWCEGAFPKWRLQT